MRVLALADKPPPMDPALMARKLRRAGDRLPRRPRPGVDRAARERRLPKLGVHGNHDAPDLLREVEVEDQHGRRTSLGGRTFAGFEGCVRYGRGGPHHYTQRQATKLAKRLPAADVLLCHCPPRGINDDPDDPSHIGFEGLRTWVDHHRPRHVLHGHTHPVAGLARTSHGDTRVHWISGARVVLLID